MKYIVRSFLPKSASASSSSSKPPTPTHTATPAPLSTTPTASAATATPPFTPTNSATPLDPFSLYRLVTHRVFNTQQQVVLLVKLLPSHYLVLTKPSLQLYLLESATLAVAAIYPSISCLSSVAAASASSFQLHFVPPTITPAVTPANSDETRLLLLALTRFCRALTSADPLTPPSPPGPYPQLAERCPYLLEVEAQNAPYLPSSMPASLSAPPPVPPAFSVPAAALSTLLAWEADASRDPIARLAASLEELHSSLTRLSDKLLIIQPPSAALTALSAKQAYNSRLLDQLTQLKGLVEDILAPLPSDFSLPAVSLLQIQLESDPFNPASPPHDLYIQRSSTLAQTHARLSLLPRIAAVAETLSLLQPQTDAFCQSLADLFCSRLSFYYGYRIPNRQILARYLPLLDGLQLFAPPSFRSQITQTWTAQMQSFMQHSATHLFVYETLVQESQWLPPSYHPIIDRAVQLAEQSIPAPTSWVKLAAELERRNLPARPFVKAQVSAEVQSYRTLLSTSSQSAINLVTSGQLQQLLLEWKTCGVVGEKAIAALLPSNPPLLVSFTLSRFGGGESARKAFRASLLATMPSIIEQIDVLRNLDPSSSSDLSFLKSPSKIRINAGICNNADLATEIKRELAEWVEARVWERAQWAAETLGQVLVQGSGEGKRWVREMVDIT